MKAQAEGQKGKECGGATHGGILHDFGRLPILFDVLFSRMSVKEQTLAWLAELPADSVVWAELHDEARMLRDIALAESDVRAGRERTLEDVKTSFEAKWTQRHSKSV